MTSLTPDAVHTLRRQAFVLSCRLDDLAYAALLAGAPNPRLERARARAVRRWGRRVELQTGVWPEAANWPEVR